MPGPIRPRRMASFSSPCLAAIRTELDPCPHQRWQEPR
jgi:hypothetical protein